MTRLEAGTGSSYPGNGALGVVDDVELTERVAASLGAELAEVGVNLDFAPVADVNTNPHNPVIGSAPSAPTPSLSPGTWARSFDGLQQRRRRRMREALPRPRRHVRGLAPRRCPTVDGLDEVALAPFRAAIDAGARSIMTAHILVRRSATHPATMSRALLHDLLRGELGFTGMVVTDALEMQAISATVGVEEGAVRRSQPMPTRCASGTTSSTSRS